MATASTDESLGSMNSNYDHDDCMSLNESIKNEDANSCQNNDDYNDGSNGVYFFESDHVALKNNSDYTNMLKTIAVLESQRIKALNDLDVLHDKLDEARQNPIKTVEKLQQQNDLGLPKPQKVADIPFINWNKYISTTSFALFASNKRLSRWKYKIEDDPSLDRNASTSASISDIDVKLVRGRVKNEGKTETFNKLWSIEEQQRLEELLIEYPEEEVEAQRFEKIATALGTRSRQQVASRIQKYFIKLAKAGIAIPGRTPALYNYQKIRKHAHSHKHQKYHRFYHTPSTFLASHEPPVYMSDEEESHDASDMMAAMNNSISRSLSTESTCDVSDDDEIPVELRETPEYKQLMQLKLVRKNKLQLSQTIHHGFKCDGCSMEPVVGVLWHCVDCPTDDSVDFCHNCSQRGIETVTHNSSHRLTSVETPQASNVIDSDYTSFQQPMGYNYLDTNFMPAT